MKIYGHRGAPAVAPENTLASFEAAFEMGCHAVECDVHLTADGQVVVIHTDCELGTIWGKGGAKIRKMTLCELKALAPVGFGGKFASERIPTLEEVYELMKKYPEKDLIVETKGDDIGAVLLEKAVDITKKYGMTHRVLFSTARDTTFEWFDKNHSDLPISMLPQDYDDRDIANALGCAGSVAVQPYVGVVDAEYMKAAHEHNLMVIPWTVDDEETVERLLKLGVDGVISNNPDVVLKVLHGR